MTGEWRAGNRVRLLENGEEFFPRVFEAIGAARSEVLVETFIVFDDPIGQQLRDALVAAAQRGARVELTVDGYGTANLSPEFTETLTRAGVRVHIFDPRPLLLGFRTNIFRRLHRKIVVIDGRLAYIGGLNFSFDHMRDFGPEGKQDYAVELEGPVVGDVQALALSLLEPPGHWWRRRRPGAAPVLPARAGEAEVMLVARDNDQRRDQIERRYREAIRAARAEIIIANAYFFPGYRFLRDLRAAARRGVTVHLVLQGNPDMPIVKWLGGILYEHLLQGGVRIHEYCERPLHGKVAVIDREWATVGSSNLDPLSLALNLEANVEIRDPAFARDLRGRLMRMVDGHCREVKLEHMPRRTLWRQFLTAAAFHAARRFPAWSGWVPGHVRPVRVTLPPPANEEPPRDREAA